ncbi:MAG: zf-HC2 domain-containing protein [Myxococcales bacterium]|nr:zf-HC2 domain-containing protein [Myxococcales bacterium]
MGMRKCITVMEEIDRIVDGEVTRMERLRFAVHLAMCEDCNRYFKQYVSVRTALGKVEPSDLPADFSDVMGRILKGANIAFDDSEQASET